MTGREGWMGRALELARRGLGNTWPNPAVGCVIVQGDAVVGEGWTQPGGRPHAEVQALAMAGDRARGATVFVSLEPCAHTGQTGPCAVALAEAGVARVVVAMQDPDPRVSGRGCKILQEAGIDVETGVCAQAAAELNAGFLSRIGRGRPRLTLKLAGTLDGRIALSSGESRWITGPEARAHVHLLRAQSDAVLIGAGTARADDPMLDLRHGVSSPRPPVRIVADPSLSTPLTGRLVQTAGDQPLWLLHTGGAARPRMAGYEAASVTLIEVPVDQANMLDLTQALRRLGDEGLNTVLCEGGGRLAAGLLMAGLVDELILMTAGKVIGADGIPSVAAMGQTELAAVPGFRAAEVRMIGPDVMSRWINDATAVQIA